MKQSWTIVIFLNFLIAATMGLLLRSAFLWEIPWMDYRNMLHGHSHVALLGWTYLLFYALMVANLVPKNKRDRPTYKWLFYLTQFAVLGMMVAFPIQGYGPVSISFSAFHILCSYLFVYRIWKDMEFRDAALRSWFRLGLVSMVLSTMGVWALGPIVASFGKISALYQVAIQFYLHFQLNGWFITIAMGLLMLFIGGNTIYKHRSKFVWMLFFYVTGLGLTYFHVLYWAYGLPVFQVLNSVGVSFQVIALGIWLNIFLTPLKGMLQKLPSIGRSLLYFGLISFISKVLLQQLLVIPYVAEMSTTVRPLIVGYIHLCMIGTASALGLLFTYHCLRISYPIWALRSWLAGFIGTEALLFVQGGMYSFRLGALPGYHEGLWAASCLLVLGIALQLGRLHVAKQPVVENQLMTSH